jgi:hypothetical protein
MPFCYVVPFPEKVVAEAFRPNIRGNSGFQNKVDLAAGIG